MPVLALFGEVVEREVVALTPSRVRQSPLQGSTILGRMSVLLVLGRGVLDADMMESSEWVLVPGRKTLSMLPLESKVRRNSRKNRILTLFSRINSLPMPLKSNSMFFFAASDLASAWRTSFTHISTVSRLNGVSLARMVKLRGMIGICPVGNRIVVHYTATPGNVSEKWYRFVRKRFF